MTINEYIQVSYLVKEKQNHKQMKKNQLGPQHIRKKTNKFIDSLRAFAVTT